MQVHFCLTDNGDPFCTMNTVETSLKKEQDKHVSICAFYVFYVVFLCFLSLVTASVFDYLWLYSWFSAAERLRVGS